MSEHDAPMVEAYNKLLSEHVAHIVGSNSSWWAECLGCDWTAHSSDLEADTGIPAAVSAHRMHTARVLVAYDRHFPIKRDGASR